MQPAQDAGGQVYQLAPGRFAVTSAHDPNRAYEVTVVPGACTCPPALGGDPVCLHCAAVRDHLRPQSEPPARTAYDLYAEALHWAYNDRHRAYKDLERFTEQFNRGDVLTDGEFLAFEIAQEREQDASTRIAELTAKMAKNVAVAA